ncbi:hypothetical protein DUNSADRAFT_13299 [Dunaliella salina]|uniref:Replication protein A subunit n=1 Tax=Dunaliella salina TaxID=3046 RepID=A0ABQ7G9S6_DUNSA|nr:hypothetical protein DUNSADRAFT_13299 [Dunaliella salina]|eukprot:KAF5831325.1 hypothetical protein DUNSADRAFT_13299 [Dunaliella salina]
MTRFLRARVYIAINLEVAGYHPEIIGNPVPMGDNPAPPPGEAGGLPMGMASMGSAAPPVGMQYGAGMAPMQSGVGMMPQARCTTKGERKRFHNARGDGQLFSFDLLDQQGSDIRVTGFGDVVDKFYDLIEPGNVYIVSRAGLLPKKPQFNHTSHQFEIRLDKDSTIEAANDEDATRIPQIIYNFKQIEELERMDVNQMVDIIGVVEQVNESQMFTRKDGGETCKRSIILRDMSNKSIDLTLWGNFVNNPGDGLEEACRNGLRPILAAKCVRLGDFGGRSLSTVSSSQVRLETQHPEAIKLQNWYQQGGSSMAAQTITTKGMGKNNRLTTLGAMKAEELWKTGKPEWISVVATIKNLPMETPGGARRSIVYEACPNVLAEGTPPRQCQKKLTELEPGSGVWSCARCGTLDAPVDYRYMASMEVSDHTAAQWITAFGEAAETVFGMSARDFRQDEEYNQEFANTLQDERNFTAWTFRLKVYEDTYQDVSRMKAQVQSLNPVDFAREGWFTLDLISKLEAGIPVLQARPPPTGAAAPQPMGMAAQPGGLMMQQPAGMMMQNPYGGPNTMAATGSFNNQGGGMMGAGMVGGNMGNMLGGGGMMGGNMGPMGGSMNMGNMGMAGPQMGNGMGMGGSMMAGGNVGMQQQAGMSPGGGMAAMQGGPMMNAQGGMGMAGGGMVGRQLFTSPMQGGNALQQQQQQQQQGITGQPLW